MMFILSLLFIGLIAFHRWFTFNIFANGDWGFIYSQILSQYLHFSLWNSLFLLGGVDVTFWRTPVNLLEGVLGNLGYSSNISEKLFVFWPTVIFANIFSYLFFKKILKSNLAAFIGSIVFNYNTYYLIIGGGFLIYAAAPWVLLSFLIFIKALESEKKYLYAISGVTLFIAGSYDFRMAYIGVILLFFYSIYYFSFISNLRAPIKILRNMLSSLISFLVFVLLNIYWILPMLRLGSLTSNAVLNRVLFGNEFLNILYSITLFHPFWTGIKPAWFTVEPITLYFWLIPAVAFFGLHLNRRNKNILFFGIVALVGIFLTKQVAHPFTGIYPWLYAHFPGFNAFREASKFYFLIALGYAVLAGALIKYVFENFKNIRVYFKYVLVIFIAFLFLNNLKPIFTGEIGNIFVPRYIPKEYITVNKLILNDKEYSRVLWTPSALTWSMFTVNHPLFNMSSIISYYDYWNNYLAMLPTDKFSIGELITKVLNLSLSNNLLDISSVRYVIVPNRDVANDADIFIFYGKSRQYYVDELNKISYLHRMNIGTKDITVYENYNYRPHMYVTNNQETISKEQAYKLIDYKFMNQAEYKFSVDNVKNPFYLNFSESYHPQWSVYLGDFKWYNILFNNQKSISNKNHMKNDAGLNSYYINPAEVCLFNEASAKGDNVHKVGVGCVRNADGSYDIYGTLYFAPQSYMYLGFIISGSSLIIILGYLGLMGFNSLKRKYERKN